MEGTSCSLANSPTLTKLPCTSSNDSPSELFYASQPSKNLTKKVALPLHFCTKATSMTNLYLGASYSALTDFSNIKAAPQNSSATSTAPSPHCAPITTACIAFQRSTTTSSPTTRNLCLLTKTKNKSIQISITIDNCLVAASSKYDTSQLYDELKPRYSISRLGFSHPVLNWSIRRVKNGPVHILQPHTIKNIPTRQNLHSCNLKPALCLYASNSQSSSPSKPLSTEKFHIFRQIFEELQYLADSPKLNIVPAVTHLAATMHTSTELNWAQL